jgi:xylan 1,4-beta-xylosidase
MAGSACSGTFVGAYAERLHLLDGLPMARTEGLSPDEEARHEAWRAPHGEADLPAVVVTERSIPYDGCDRPVPVRVYQPLVTAIARPALMWMHGGAFMFGDLDMPEADHVARILAHDGDAVVVSVDYRLCVDGVHHPAPHDDCMAVYGWMQENAADLGIDPTRIAVGGASAGGNLAAGVALHLTDQGARPWQALLAYPAVHSARPEPSDELRTKLDATPSALRFPPDVTAWINTQYLGPEGPQRYAFAGDADDLTGYPPTFIENDEFDDLRASGEAFATQLRAAGVPVEMTTACGVSHGHLNPVGSPQMRASLVRYAERLLGRFQITAGADSHDHLA